MCCLAAVEKSDYVKKFKEQAMFWHNMCKENGSPQGIHKKVKDIKYP